LGNESTIIAPYTSVATHVTGDDEVHI